MASAKVRNEYKSNRLQGKQRARVVTFVLWPESTDIERVDRLIDAAHVQGARSPLHDRDVYTRPDVEGWLHRHKVTVDLDWSEDELRAVCEQVEREMKKWVPWIGDLKKPHYHYVLAFEGSKSAAQVVDLIGGATDYIENVVSKRGTLAYLIHRRNPEKAQYDFEDIKVFGGMDLSGIYAIGELERLDYKDLIMDAIFDGRARSWVQLVRWVRKQKDPNMTAILYANKYLFEGTIISLNSENAAKRKLLGSTPEPLRDFERDMFPAEDSEVEKDVGDFDLVEWVKSVTSGTNVSVQLPMDLNDSDCFEGC